MHPIRTANQSPCEMAMDAHKVSVHTPSGQDFTPHGVEPLHAGVFPQVCLPPSDEGTTGFSLIADTTCARPASQDSPHNVAKKGCHHQPHRRGGKQAGGIYQTSQLIHDMMMMMMMMMAASRQRVAERGDSPHPKVQWRSKARWRCSQ